MQIRAVGASQAQVRLVMEGELDLASSAALGEAVDALGDRTRQVILDLRALTFVDSHGVRAVLAVRSALAERGLALAVIQGPEQVARVFALTGVDRLVEVISHPSQAPAFPEPDGSAPEQGHPLARWSSFRTGAPPTHGERGRVASDAPPGTGPAGSARLAAG